MPSHLISAWNCLALYCEPQSCRRPRAQGDGLAEAAHVGPDALADWLQRRPAVALLRNVPANDVRSAVVDGREEPAPALRLRPEPRRVRAPEFVRPLGADPAAVAPVSLGFEDTPRYPASRRLRHPWSAAVECVSVGVPGHRGRSPLTHVRGHIFCRKQGIEIRHPVRQAFE